MTQNSGKKIDTNIYLANMFVLVRNRRRWRREDNEAAEEDIHVQVRSRNEYEDHSSFDKNIIIRKLISEDVEETIKRQRKGRVDAKGSYEKNCKLTTGTALIMKNYQKMKKHKIWWGHENEEDDEVKTYCWESWWEEAMKDMRPLWW